MDLTNWIRQEGKGALTVLMRRSGLAWDTICKAAKRGHVLTRATAIKISAATDGDVSVAEALGTEQPNERLAAGAPESAGAGEV